MQQKEEPQRKQQAERPSPKDRGASILSSVFLSTGLTPVPTVALALEVRAELRQLGFARYACNPQLAVVAADAVRLRAEVEVHVAVCHFAQAAAVVFAQELTAVLGGRGHIEEVAAQRSLEVFVHGRAPGLRGRGGQTQQGC